MMTDCLNRSTLLIFLLAINCLLIPKTLANPIVKTDSFSKITAENSRQEFSSNLAELDLLSDRTLTLSVVNNSEKVSQDRPVQEEIVFSKTIDKISESSFNSSCSHFTPLINTIKPNQPSIQRQDSDNQVVPTSACAADLFGGENILHSQLTSEEGKAPKSEEILPPETFPDTLPNNGKETQIIESKDWHIDIQPYATIPVTTYGSVTVGTRSVDYHLNLGELMDVLRVAASGRIEAWKGNFGLIFDGY